MASITSVGLGSGLDANSIVDKLVAVEHIPVDNLQTLANKIQTKVSSYGKLQSAVSGLRDAASKLTNPDTWNATASTSSDPAAVSVTTDATASAGAYSVAVQTLAASQSVVSPTYSSAGSVIGIGTLHIELGNWNGSQTAFSSNPNWPKADITIGPNDNSLEKVRDKINASGAGVVASVVTDATGSRLVLRSTSTGSDNGFRVTADDADGNNNDASGLSALTYDPASADPANPATTMTLNQAATNAQVKINGLDLTSSTNTFSGAVQGMTFKVGKVTTTNPVDLSVTQDTDAMKKAVTDFATAYTALNTFIKDQTKYDPTSKTSAPLQGDSTVNSILAGARSLLSQTSGASSKYSRLSDIGLSIDATGALTANATKLTAALSSNQAEVKKLFANLDSASPSNEGFGQRYKNFADRLLNSDGSITTVTEGLQKRIDSNSKQQQAMEQRIAAYKTRLLAQYNALDTTMAQLNGTSNYVTQQLATMSRGY